MEAESEDEGDVFRIPDLWRPSRCLKLGPNYDSFLFAEPILDDIYTQSPDIIQASLLESHFFSIPDLPFDLSSPIPLARPEVVAVDDQTVECKAETETIDFWLLPYEKPLKAANYQSWDAFQYSSHKEPCNAYITETGPRVLDAALVGKEDYLHANNADHAVVENTLFLKSLMSLGLGRSSTLFTWDEGSSSFRQTTKQPRISGYTGESIHGVCQQFVECGTLNRYLRKFVEQSYQKKGSASQIALAEVVQSIVTGIEKQLSASAATSTGILQLQALFDPAHTLLTLLADLITRMTASRDDEAMLSILFQEIQTLDGHDRPLRDILLEIFTRISKPWLEFANEWIGVRKESGIPMSKTGSSKAFVLIENRLWTNEQGEEFEEPDYMLDLDRIPSFLPHDDARLMFEVGKTLRLLRTHHPDHALSRDDIVPAESLPELTFAFDWKNVLEVERKARKYETDLRDALDSFASCPIPILVKIPAQIMETNDFDFFGKPLEELEAHFLASIERLDISPSRYEPIDHLKVKLRAYLRYADDSDDETHALATSSPDIALVPSLSFGPLLATQARFVNGTIVRLLFKSHNLREHLSIQRQFHLLGNGNFSSRLSHALFDPELETAERQRGVARSGNTMGLRLGGRDTWPPASSELRLALMGVLTESYTPTTPTDKSRVDTFLDETAVPGDLSFAVRDMSEQEMHACKNAASLQALDFLRLSYKSPAPLDSVITPIILYKYDQIFRLLLRVLRMLYVVSTFFVGRPKSAAMHEDRIVQRFRIEARHFVSSISGYFFESGINATWRRFESKLDEVETRIDDAGANNLRADEGIDNLRDYHEMVLDKILFSLLLRKRQQAVMKLLEEIFDLILKFSEHRRQQNMTDSAEKSDGMQVKQLYQSFKQKVTVFVNVCRGMAEKKGYGDKESPKGHGVGQQGLFDGGDLAEENTISHLLCKLDMFGYYSQ